MTCLHSQFVVLLKTTVVLVRKVLINTEIETLHCTALACTLTIHICRWGLLSNKTVCIASIGHKGTKSNLEVAAAPQYTNWQSSFIANFKRKSFSFTIFNYNYIQLVYIYNYFLFLRVWSGIEITKYFSGIISGIGNQ